MKILLAYIAVANGPLTFDYCARFVGSYLAFPPGIDHDTVVCCNGGPLNRETSLLFESINCQFFPRINDEGYDLSAFQDVARKFQCDCVVCCGESIYFHRAGWLLRYAEAWKKHGPGMYGTFSSNLVRPHLNTTGFVIDPRFLNGYPSIRNRTDRYNCEHGKDSLWLRVHNLGFAVRCVTWDGEWLPQYWRNPHDILWKNSQTNCLMQCQHTDRFRAASEETKQAWAKGANAPFRT